MEAMPLRPSADQVRSLVLSDHSHTRQQFIDHFGAELDSLVASLARAFGAYRDVDDQSGLGTRASYVAAFFFTALNCLVTSSQLFLAGMLIPAGNLMRQYGESVAMALLCSAPQLDVLARLERDPKRFPIHTSLDLVNRRAARRALAVDHDGWERFHGITKWYDNFSHPSLLVLQSQIMFSSEGMNSIGGEFDGAKTEQYRIELVRRRSAADLLVNIRGWLISALTDPGARRPPASPAA